MSKEFKETEIGMIPRDWDMDALSSVCLKPCQWNPNKELRTDFTYIDVSAVSNETCKVAYPTQVDAKNAPSRARKIINAGDVIYATVRPELRRIAFIEKEYDNQIASTAFCVVRADASKSNGKYLYYSLRTEKINRMIAEFQRGASYPAVTDKDILRQQIPLPPLPEQKKIAAVLSKLQKAIEIQDNILGSLRDLQKSMMHRFFSYGLKGEKRKKTEIGLIPDGWDVKPIGTIGSFLNGLNFSQDARGDGIRFVNVKDIYKGLVIKADCLESVDFGNKDISKYALHTNDLLFVRSSLKQEGVGWSAMIPAHKGTIVFCGFLIRYRLSSSDVMPLYLAFILSSQLMRKEIIRNSSKMTITNISQDGLGAVCIPVPPLPEQTEIAHILQTIDRKIEIHEGKKSSYQDLFKTMLNKLMTGTIRVNELDIDTAEVEAA